MPWAQFDDRFNESEGALLAGPEACGLYLHLYVWCSGNLSDGHVPDVVARAYLARCEGGGEVLAGRLEDAGLLDRSGDDWHLPRYLDHNASAAEVEARREARAASGKRGGQSRARREAEARGADDEEFQASAQASA